MMKLYWSPRSRSFSTLWLMEETGEPYERVLTDISKGAQKTIEFLAVNPMGKVPAILHKGALVTELPAIFIYLADAFPQKKLAPSIDDPLRGPYLRWLVFYSAAFEPAALDRLTKREPPPRGMNPYGDFDTTLATLESQLAQGRYILGERFTAADVRRVANTYFTADNRNVATVVRKAGKSASEDPDLVGLSPQQLPVVRQFLGHEGHRRTDVTEEALVQIGRASCRERV